MQLFIRQANSHPNHLAIADPQGLYTYARLLEDSTIRPPAAGR